jgi:predicted nuclease of predicted toxin-antitoxin system
VVAKIRFYLDESVHVAVANSLKRRGVDAISARDAGNLGLSDEEQFRYAIKNNFVIVTHDADFLSLAIDYEHRGIVFVHQQKYSIGDFVRRLKLLWDVTDQKDMKDHVEFL